MKLNEGHSINENHDVRAGRLSPRLALFLIFFLLILLIALPLFEAQTK